MIYGMCVCVCSGDQIPSTSSPLFIIHRILARYWQACLQLRPSLTRRRRWFIRRLHSATDRDCFTFYVHPTPGSLIYRTPWRDFLRSGTNVHLNWPDFVGQVWTSHLTSHLSHSSLQNLRNARGVSRYIWHKQPNGFKVAVITVRLYETKKTLLWNQCVPFIS